MSEPHRDARRLGALDATLLVMGGIVGVGIFFTPQSVAALVPEEGAFFALWIVGGLIALCAAWSFAELGGTFPRSGGWFVYLREAFGDFPAYLFAWVVLFAISTGAMAAIVGFSADRLHDAFPAVVGEQESASRHVAALAIVLGLTAVTLTGVKRAAVLQNACMITKSAVLVTLTVVGLAFVPGGEEVAPSATAAPEPEGPLAGRMVVALLPVFFSFGGWQLVCYIAPQIRDPERALPRAIVVGVLGVLALYLLANVGFVRGLGTDGLAADPGFAATLSRTALGPTGERVLAVGMAVSAIGVCAVNVITGPWLYVAMARERLFFDVIGRVHPRTGVPVNALLLQAGFVVVYYFTQTLQQLVNSVVFVEWVFHGLAAVALLRLRRRRPELPRPFRSPLYPLGPVVYAVAAVVVVAGTLWQADREVWSTGLQVLAVGTIVYRPWRALVERAAAR